MALILKLDLDMVKIYLHSKNEIPDFQLNTQEYINQYVDNLDVMQ